MNAQAQKPYVGLPDELPRGEAVLWQGKPSWRSLAVRAFHVRKIAIYFGLLVAWRVGLALYERVPPKDGFFGDIGLLLAVALCALCILTLMAWLYAKTTTYTITNRRVYMHFGAALPMMLNLPFAIVGAAGAKVHRDGTADIPLQLTGTGRVAYMHLWPHARPWHLKNPEPMLRSIPDGARVAALLASALAEAAPPPANQAVGIVPAEKASRDALSVLTPAAA